MSKHPFTGLFFFAVGILAITGVLKFANWLPLRLQEGTLRTYESVEEVQRRLKVKDIPVLAYMPQYLSWPPAEIIAQTIPFEAVLMTFNGPQGDTMLVVCRSASEDFDPSWDLRMDDAVQTTVVDLKGRKAVMESGPCSDGAACSRMKWEEDGYRTSLIMRGPPFELLRIAESMLD